MIRWLVALAGTCLIAGLIGCGGGDNKSEKKTEQQTAAPSTPAAQTVNVSESEFKLDPSDPSIKQTGVVAFKVTNKGKIAHSLEVEGPGGEAKLPKNLESGQSATLKVDLSKAGKYEWYCPIDDHKGLGMKGEITVAGGGSAKSGGSGGQQTNTTDQSGSNGSAGGGSGY